MCVSGAYNFPYCEGELGMVQRRVGVFVCEERERERMCVWEEGAWKEMVLSVK